jgi:hypothetical protein
VRLSLALLILSACGVGAGLGWWIHPGLGLAVTSLCLGGVALFRDDGTQQKGHGR